MSLTKTTKTGVLLLIACITGALCVAKAKAQSTDDSPEYINERDVQVWYTGQAIARVSENWRLSLQSGHRRLNFGEEALLSFVRPSVIYTINSRFTIQPGYAYFVNHPAKSKRTIDIPEHRAFVFVNYVLHKGPVSNLVARYRTEYRMPRAATTTELLGGYKGYVRIGAQINYERNLFKMSGRNVVGSVSQELMANLGKNVAYNKFDQSRSLLGLGLPILPTLKGQIAYCYIIQHRPQKATYSLWHTFRVSMVLDLDLRRKA